MLLLDLPLRDLFKVNRRLARAGHEVQTTAPSNIRIFGCLSDGRHAKSYR